nr:hypothetical protein GZ17C7_30 [uncultured archaeon GZfos17C7]AAU84068.1 hypothetical protein GZ36D8_24 [uncultured archaeon GZfos36D8]
MINLTICIYELSAVYCSSRCIKWRFMYYLRIRACYMRVRLSDILSRIVYV